MPTVPIYIRKKNNRFLTEEEPSELVNNLLEAHYNNEDYPLIKLPDDSIKEPASPNPSPSKGLKKLTEKKGTHVRNKGTILKEIDEMKAECQEKLEYCQDPTEIGKINEDYKQTIDSLWEEYNASN